MLSTMDIFTENGTELYKVGGRDTEFYKGIEFTAMMVYGRYARDRKVLGILPNYPFWVLVHDATEAIYDIELWGKTVDFIIDNANFYKIGDEQREILLMYAQREKEFIEKLLYELSIVSGDKGTAFNSPIMTKLSQAVDELAAKAKKASNTTDES